MAYHRPRGLMLSLSSRQITVLVASFFVALGAGTNYIYSGAAYSPQLGARLNISYTQLNIIGLAGNVGVSASAPIWGRIVDSQGPRILFVLSFVFLLGGYSGIKHLYDSGLPPGISTLPAFSFYILVLFNFLIGCGSFGGMTSSLNSTVKSFPDKIRASATGLVMAGFGLSAFFFTTLSNTLLRSTTSTFLLILALGTSCLMLLGFLFVRPVPLPEKGSSQLEDGDDDPEPALSPALQHHNHSRTPLLNDDSIKNRYVRNDITPNGGYSNTVGGVMEATRSVSPKLSPLNIHGKALLSNLDFWLLFSVSSMLLGTGYTYINNVGTMSRSLYAHNNPEYDDAHALRWQATQVSVISLTNFGGRFLIGFFSDFAMSLYRTPRSHCLVLVAFLYFISQVVVANTSNVSNLWIGSALLGLAHGSLSGLIPTVCLEWFGLPHFSENWGYIVISPILSLNLISFLFGRTLDAHAGKPVEDLLFPTTTTTTIATFLGPPRCLEGRDCYVGAIYLTIGTSLLSFFLSLWAGYRDSRKAAKV